MIGDLSMVCEQVLIGNLCSEGGFSFMLGGDLI